MSSKCPHGLETADCLICRTLQPAQQRPPTDIELPRKSPTVAYLAVGAVVVAVGIVVAFTVLTSILRYLDLVLVPALAGTVFGYWLGRRGRHRDQ